MISINILEDSNISIAIMMWYFLYRIYTKVMCYANKKSVSALALAEQMAHTGSQLLSLAVLYRLAIIQEQVNQVVS